MPRSRLQEANMLRAMDVMAIPKSVEIGEHIYCDVSHYPPARADLMVWREGGGIKEGYIGICFGCANRAVAGMRRLKAAAAG